MSDSARTFRFSPLDRTGWLLGLSGSQCVAVGAGIFAAGLLLDAGLPIGVALLPPMLTTAFAFASWDRRSLHEWAPTILRYLRLRAIGQLRWSAQLPLLTGTPTDSGRQPPLPPFLTGLSILDVGALAWSPSTIHDGAAVVSDRRQRTLSASVRVRGREFSLIERSEQERIVQLWGDALAGFCTERGPVSRIRVTEWAAPGGAAERARLTSASPVASDHDAARSYDELLAEAGPSAIRHEILVTLTVDQRRIRRRDTSRPDSAAGIDTLFEELRLLTSRLEGAGLTVSPPLSARETATALRLRLDPQSADPIAVRGASLAELAGLLNVHSATPLATESTWGRLRADGAFHRTYWVAEWPRLDVPPNWLEPLLLYGGGVRTFALHYEPVPPSRSQRRIDRDSTRLAADEEQRARTGFRVGARHRRAQTAVAEREAELVAGYAELEFAGFLTVSAADEQTLERSCAEYEQAAAQAGLELRALHGRHDLGVVCALPVGRGLAERRWT